MSVICAVVFCGLLSFCLLLHGHVKEAAARPAWDPVTLLAASPGSQASGEVGGGRNALLSSGKSADCTFNQTGRRFFFLLLASNDLVLNHQSFFFVCFFYSKMMTWNSEQADQVSVVSLSDIRASCCCIRHLFLQSHRLSVFGIRALELCSPAAELHNETFPAERQESAVYITVLYNHEQHFPDIERIQKLKQRQDKTPWTLVSTAFKMTTSDTSRRWRVKG